jgi:hypothetical protein
VATAGYYRLAWQPPAEADEQALQYELQESPDGGFEQPVVLYRGPDLATVLSGRDDGLRHYRVRALRDGEPVSPWSETLVVETRHHSPGRALAFFSVGAVIFVSTLVLVIHGGRQHAHKDAGSG